MGNLEFGNYERACVVERLYIAKQILDELPTAALTPAETETAVLISKLVDQLYLQVGTNKKGPA